MHPADNELWFLPLGGCGEIGMNMNLYGHQGQWLMVDCGLTFPRKTADGRRPQAPVQMADPAFIADRREQLAGLVITHAHEDHVGAVQYLWPLLRCPVYTNAFTAEILRRKLAEQGLAGQVPITVIDLNGRRPIGPFDVQFLPVTHSIPHVSALMIRTKAGSVFHSSDWKLDANPLVGENFSPLALQQLGDEGIDALVCDSTNANVPGHSESESALYPGLRKAIAEAPGRVVVACFGSNIARLHTLAAVARDSGRYMGLLGRSLVTMQAAARATGLWLDQHPLINPAHLGYLPSHEVLAVATGSQGEPRTALTRLARDDHPDLTLEPGDTVLFSARAIPGNEADIQRLMDQLRDRGIRIITPEMSELPIHASGHPAADELRKLFGWIRPGLLIPVHGEAEHMQANHDLAADCGIHKRLLGQNGDLFMIKPYPGIRRGVVNTGRLGMEKGSLVPVTD
ncbi:MAG: ribonuclease J [Halomonadaceae bacterium]|nr:MAG: ribonuclease J [Halomonadaceae bacterium]